MEKETRITAPDGCEIEKVKIVDGVAVVTFREKERKLPKSWDEFCELFPNTKGEFYLNAYSVLALCQLIQLRNCYNGDWVPDWTDPTQDKFIIEICKNEIECSCVAISIAVLYFKTEKLRDEFLRNFRPLIEKLKPMYGIKEGGK